MVLMMESSLLLLISTIKEDGSGLLSYRENSIKDEESTWGKRKSKRWFSLSRKDKGKNASQVF